MTPENARELILLHGCVHAKTGDPRRTHGFLGMLRPYSGLDESNFDEVITALRVLSPHLRDADSLDHELVAALFGMCTFARHWGCHVDGMLQRNGLITEHDAKTLADWIDRISWAVAMLLGGADDASAFGGP